MEKVKEKNYFFSLLKSEINKVIIGQEYMIDRLLIGLLGNGHVLLEGVPGLAKTLAIKTLADAVQGQYSRIQFTPDLLPADVVGTMIYNVKDNDFSIKKGPVFANFVLADEINRAPAKVQSALLEVMQEKQVTIGDTTMKLPKPFLVLATQNPIDQEGTYLLPEAQSDRFMMKCSIDYPTFEDERKVMRMVSTSDIPQINPIISLEQIVEAKELINKIYLDEKIEKYILDMVFATRYPEQYGLSDLKNYITFGASPRASINLAIASRALAFIRGRAFVIPEDVKEISKDVLRHRIGLSFEAEAEEMTAEKIIDAVLSKVQAP
ncbi:MoxR-like ATPase in aerotolerance operon [Elizabethkingia anophelis]|nr:MoxR-like ATPase in aerotolerance operon [Elizabethkingia anophelis]